MSALRGAYAVVHLAAESHVDRSITGARAVLRDQRASARTNYSRVRVASGVERFVHVSTDEVYGSIGEGSWSEDHLLEPNSPYSSSKAGSDLAALAYHRTYGLPVMVTRCSNNYGPRQFPEKVIPLFVTNLFDGEKVPLYGDGLNVRDWLFVDDHCRGHPRRPRGRPHRRDLQHRWWHRTDERGVDRAAARSLWLRRDSMIEPMADRLGHDRRYCVDWSKINDELGYEPQTSFDEGLANTVKWYHDNEAWWRPLKASQ